MILATKYFKDDILPISPTVGAIFALIILILVLSKKESLKSFSILIYAIFFVVVFEGMSMCPPYIFFPLSFFGGITALIYTILMRKNLILWNRIPLIIISILLILNGSRIPADIVYAAKDKGPTKADFFEKIKRKNCVYNLENIGQSIQSYYKDNNAMPQNLIEPTTLDKWDLVCPITRDKEGAVNYVYRGSDLPDDAPDNMIMAYEPLSNHLRNGSHILFVNNHVEWFEEQPFLNAINTDNNLRQQLGLHKIEVQINTIE